MMCTTECWTENFLPKKGFMSETATTKKWDWGTVTWKKEKKCRKTKGSKSKAKRMDKNGK